MDGPCTAGISHSPMGHNLPPCTTQFLESWFCHYLGQDFHFIPGSSTQLLHDWRKPEQVSRNVFE